MIARLEWTSSNVTITDSHNWSNNKQQQNHRLRTDSDLSHRGGGGGGGCLNALYWYQIFAQDSAVIGVQEVFNSHGSLLIIAMNTLIKLTHYDETKKMAHR